MTSSKKALMSTITGLGYGAPSCADAIDVVMAEEGASWAAIIQLPLLSGSSTVFAPEGLFETVPGGVSATVIQYAGSLGGPGDEMVLDEDFYLQTLAYGVLEFVDLPGPTAVTTTSEEDIKAYLNDAEVAVEKGLFAGYLMNPEVQLFDLEALGYPTAADPLRRVYVNEFGERLVSPGERLINPAGIDLMETNAEQSKSVDNSIPKSFGPVSASRYCVVTDSLKYIAARGGTGLRASGFGGRLSADESVTDTDHDMVHPLSPVLVWDDKSRFFIHLPGPARTFEVDATVADAVDRRYYTSEPSPVLDAVATRLGVDWTTSWE